MTPANDGPQAAQQAKLCNAPIRLLDGSEWWTWLCSKRQGHKDDHRAEHTHYRDDELAVYAVEWSEPTFVRRIERASNA